MADPTNPNAPAPVVMDPSTPELFRTIAELRSQNEKFRKQLDDPEELGWRVIRSRRHSTRREIRFDGPNRLALDVNASTFLAMSDPAAILDCLKQILARINADPERMGGLRFKDQTEFEACQLRLVELIRLYENLA